MVLRALLALWSMWLQPRLRSISSMICLPQSAAKATEYMLKTAAASVAAFLLDGQTDLLPALAAKAFLYMEWQNIKRMLPAAAAAATILVRSLFVAVVLHMSEWCWFVAGFLIGCILLWNSCHGKGKKQG